MDSAMSIEELLDQASALLGAHRYDAAAALIDAALAMSPGSVPALILRARCRLRTGDPRLALPDAQEALRLAREPDLAAAREVVAECLRAVGGVNLEAARIALRGRDTDRAWGILRGLAADRFVVLVCAYTARRPLHRDGLEEVLGWLLREELDEAAAALERREHGPARAAVARANAIDGRALRAAYLEAAALYGGLRPAGAEADLRRAAVLAERAAASGELRERAARLRTAIGAAARAVEAAGRVRRAEALLGRYQALVATYTGRPVTMFEASNARRSLASLGTDVTRLRQQCPAGSPEGRLLARLAAAITGLQQQLRGIV
jgi:hypothetical protein